MAITIPPYEIQVCEKLLMPAWIAAALQNDIFSWPKERDAAQRHGHADVVNAVWVLMGEHEIGEAEAMALCRTKTKEYIAEYVEIFEKNRENPELSSDLRRYLEAILYSLSGNAVWSITCPRYHTGNSYNKFQLSLMENGIQETLDSTSTTQATRLNRIDQVLTPAQTS